MTWCPVWANILTVGQCQVVVWTGELVAEGVESVAGEVLDGAARSAGQSAGQLITASLGWWTFNGSVDFDSPAIELVQSYTMPLSIIMLMAGVVLAGARTALSRRGEPLLHLFVNLLWFVVASVAGLGVFGGLQAGGDAFSAWIIAQSGANLGDRFEAAALSNATGAFGVIIISLLCVIIAVIQWLLMLFRTAALVILAGLLPFAAATSVVQGRTDSVKTVVTWSCAILIYKPCAAIVYAQGFFTLSDGATLMTMLQGVVILLMAIIALPALVKLFSWAGSSVSSGGGGIAAAAGLAGLMMARRGGGDGDGAEGSGGSGGGGAESGGGSGGGLSGGGLAGQHAQELESGGSGASGGGMGDTPAASGGVGGDVAAGSFSGHLTGGADGQAAVSGGAAGAEAPTTGGGAGAAGAGGGAHPAVMVAERAYGAVQNATESATESAQTGPDEPS